MTHAERQQLKTAVQILAGTHLRDNAQYVFCSVDSVDEAKQVCTCTPIGGDSTTQIPAVKLTAEENDGLLYLPKIGSTVVVVFSQRSEPFVALFSDIDKIIIIAETSVQFQDGTFGGLVKVNELTDKINVLEDDLNTLKQAFNNWIVTPNDGGAALKATAATWTGQSITVTNKSDIENTKINHGQ